MLNVNTIEFEGRKAVINSYSDHPALAPFMHEQREKMAKRYPKASVRTERMSETDTAALVATDKTWNQSAAWEIGQASEAVQ